MTGRLPAALEATALIRRAEAAGGFGAVLRKGDPDSGALVLLIRQRDALHALLERRLGPDFNYVWTRAEPPKGGESPFLADRTRIDPDLWLIELDIADAERFIAETTDLG